ncbi:uncharacterized protein [Palaemon carinicauda]|uniref:uncharacterized protein n=1 Tax=Palaemon carinicauda TaxID=392227 RepID=UPI0035B5D161
MEVSKENSTVNENLRKLMVIIKGAIADKLASTPDNAEAWDTLKDEFSILVNTSSALREQLKNINYGRNDIEGAIYHIFLEESIGELPKTLEDNYCKPSLQREHKVSIGTEYLAKCECVPGEGPTMTYTPIQEGSQCQQAASAQTENLPWESPTPSV